MTVTKARGVQAGAAEAVARARLENALAANESDERSTYGQRRQSLRKADMQLSLDHESLARGYAYEADAMRSKLEYDLYYLKHCSLWLDLVIVLRTFAVVLRGTGAR